MKYWIETYKGNIFDYENIETNVINIDDIAHALSNNCRFNGHPSSFYNVAEHSIHVAKVIDKHLALAGLLHDGTEAYIPDIPTPLKTYWNTFFPLEKFEDKILKRIYSEFNIEFNETDWKTIKQYDKAVLREERNVLFTGRELWNFPKDIPKVDINIRNLSPVEAEMEFLNLFYKLIFN